VGPPPAAMEAVPAVIAAASADNLVVGPSSSWQCKHLKRQKLKRATLLLGCAGFYINALLSWHPLRHAGFADGEETNRPVLNHGPVSHSKALLLAKEMASVVKEPVAPTATANVAQNASSAPKPRPTPSSPKKDVQPTRLTPPIAAGVGFLLAVAIVGPALPWGPTLTLPLGVAALLGQLTLFRTSSSIYGAMLYAAMGVPLAHLLMLIPCATLQYAMPGVVGPVAGLCTAVLLGGEGALRCYMPAGVLVTLVHTTCLVRILSMGGW